MNSDGTPPPLGICLLADHLDAALAAAEDLVRLELVPPAVAGPDAPDDLVRFIRRIRHFEEVIVARLLEMRRRLKELRNLDPNVASVLRLLASQTTAILEIADRLIDRSQQSYATGGDPLEFLRLRQIITSEAAFLSPESALSIGEGMHLGGVLRLGTLMDLLAATTGALDVAYDLYPEIAIDEARPAIPANETSETSGLGSGDEPAGASPPPSPSFGPVTARSLIEALSDVRTETPAEASI